MKSTKDTRSIPAGEFKAHCLRLMDEVSEKDLTLIVTKRGKPVVRVSSLPPEERPFVPLWGRTPAVRIVGDIITPLEWAEPGEKWDRVHGRPEGES